MGSGMGAYRSDLPICKNLKRGQLQNCGLRLTSFVHGKTLAGAMSGSCLGILPLEADLAGVENVLRIKDLLDSLH